MLGAVRNKRINADYEGVSDVNEELVTAVIGVTKTTAIIARLLSLRFL